MTHESCRPLPLRASIAVAILLAIAPAPLLLAGVCTVPGSHTTIQEAIDDEACTSITLSAQTYAESLNIPRSLILAGPGAGGAIVEGLVRVVGAGTAVTLQDLAVQNGCPLSAVRSVAGAEVSGIHLTVEGSAALPCLPSLIFQDGFESGDTSAWSATLP